MAYYYVEDIEASMIVLHILKVCSKYFPVPTIIDGIELKQKLDYLNKLYTIWTENIIEDSSYQSEVYKHICEMFSKNVFRSSALSSYKHEDEINIETMWEFKQLHPVYRVFAAFLNLNGFDEEKLAPYVDGKFINGLVQRLDSCVEVERDCVKRILFRLLDSVACVREYILRGTINSLADCDRARIHGGVKELLELFNVFVCHRLIESPIIIEVLSPLIKQNGLCHFADQLHECFVTAARVVNVNLSSRFVEYTIDNWRVAAADVPSLCRTLAALYFDACGPESARRVRNLVVSHVTACLTAAASGSPQSSAAAAAECQAYVEFCGRLIDEPKFNDCDDDAAPAERVAEALVAVHRNHGHYDCVEYAERLLKRLIGIGSDGGERCLVGHACRLSVMESLIEHDRLRKTTESLIDNTF